MAINNSKWEEVSPIEPIRSTPAVKSTSKWEEVKSPTEVLTTVLGKGTVAPSKWEEITPASSITPEDFHNGFAFTIGDLMSKYYVPEVPSKGSTSPKVASLGSTPTVTTNQQPNAPISSNYGVSNFFKDIKQSTGPMDVLGKVGNLPEYAGTVQDVAQSYKNLAQNVTKGDFKGAAKEALNIQLFGAGRTMNLGKGIGVIVGAYADAAKPQPDDTPESARKRWQELTNTIILGTGPALVDWASKYRFIGTKGILQPDAHLVKAALTFAHQESLAKQIPTEEIDKIANEDWNKYKDYWNRSPEFAAMDVIMGLSTLVGTVEKFGLTPTISKQIEKLPAPIRDTIVNKYQYPSSLYVSPGGATYAKGVLRAKGELSLGELQAQEAAQAAKTSGVTAAQLNKPMFNKDVTRMADYLRKKYPVVDKIPLVVVGKEAAGVGKQGLLETIANESVGATVLPKPQAIQGAIPSIEKLLKANGLPIDEASKIAKSLVTYSQKIQKLSKVTPISTIGKLAQEVPPTIKAGEFATKFKEQTILSEQELNRLYPTKTLEKAQTESYIHRTYDPKFKPTPEQLTTVKEWLVNKGKMTPEEADGFIANSLEKKSMGVVRNGKVIQVKYNKSGLMERANVPEMIRKNLYGEVVEPSVMVYNTIKSQKDLEIMGNFYDNLEKNPEITWQGPDKFQVGYTSIPEDGRFGTLAGKLVRDHVAKDLYAALEQTPKWLNAWRKFVGVVFKGPKTVYQVSTQARNVQFDVPLAWMAGVDPSDIGLLADVTKSYIGKDIFYREVLRRGGVGGTSYAESEVLNLMNDVHKRGDAVEGLGNFAKKVANIPQKAYAIPDDLTKLTVIRKKLVEFGGSDPKMWTPQMYDRAIDYARNSIPYYDLKPPYAKFLSDTTLSPFFMFTHEMMRTMVYNARFHPVRVAMVAETPKLVNMASMARLGVTPQEDDKIRSMMPDYMKNSLLSLVDKKNGKYYYMDLTYTMGMDNPVAALLRPTSLLGGPTLSTLGQFKYGIDDLGRPIVRPGENPLLSHGKAIAQRFSPNWTPFVGSTYEKWRKVYRGEEKANAGITFLDSLGVRIIEVDPDELRKSYVGHAKGEMKALKSRIWTLNRRAGEFKGYTDVEAETKRNDLIKQYFELYNKHKEQLK